MQVLADGRREKPEILQRFPKSRAAGEGGTGSIVARSMIIEQ
jgi:hypothetical protein